MGGDKKHAFENGISTVPISWLQLLGTNYVSGDDWAPPSCVRCVFLTAPSGSGKTTALHRLAENNPTRAVVFSPTITSEANPPTPPTPNISGPMLLIIDALDELLAHGRSLDAVLNGLAPFNDRPNTKYIFAARPGTLDDAAINRICTELALCTTDTSSRQANVACVEFAPLSREDGIVLATPHCANPDALIKQLLQDKDDNLSASYRPWDIIQRARIQGSYGDLGEYQNAFALLELSYSELRTERQRTQRLTYERFREAICRLAALCIATDKWFIQRDPARFAADGNTLAIRDALPDWSNQELHELFQSNIFQEKPGTVVLATFTDSHENPFSDTWAHAWAAAWFDQQIRQGWPVKEAVRFLLPDNGKQLALRREPLAAWLAQANPAVFSAIFQQGTPALLQYGDARRYTAMQKRLLLRNLKDLPEQVRSPKQSFASADLSATLLELLSDKDYYEHQALLLGYATETSCRDCIDIARDIAFSNPADNQATAQYSILGTLASRIHLKLMHVSLYYWPENSSTN